MLAVDCVAGDHERFDLLRRERHRVSTRGRIRHERLSNGDG